MDKSLVQRFIEWIIVNGGLYVLLLIEFAETGTFLGLILPGDSLVFAAGIYVNDLAKEFFNVPYYIIILLVILVSTLGSLAGYWFGYKTGPYMYEWKDNLLFKKKYLISARAFYDKHGRITVFISKFLPFIRTFVPPVAGITKMSFKTYLLYTVLGTLCWVTSMMLGGRFLQSWMESKYGFSLKDHIEAITLVIVAATTLPILYKLLFGTGKA